VPALVISQEVCDELSEIWNRLQRHLRNAFWFGQEAQMTVLDIMAKG
jgi:hypothetical protein